jgi:ferric-dicitrate binding protein FerR (iron transport regulator)
MTQDDADPARPDDIPDQDVRDLITAAGGRREPPAEMRDRVYTRLAGAFDALPDPEARTRTRHRAGAVAAALVSGLLAVTAWQASRPPPAAVATLVFARGEAVVQGLAAAAGQALAPQAELETRAGGRLQLRLHGGAEVRVDGASRLRLLGPDRVLLEQGRLFAATQGRQSLLIATALGEVADLGTRFDVSLGSQGLAVTVREGRIEIEGGGRRLRAEAAEGRGETVRLDRAGGVARRPVPTTDAYWQWIDDARREYTLDEGSLHDFLQWSANECGLQLRYADVRVEQAARATQVHGQLHERCLVAVDQVLATSRLQRRTEVPPHRLLIAFDE